MYVINRDPAQVIPNISEDFIISKNILLIAKHLHRNVTWVAILDLSNFNVSWYGSNTTGLVDINEWTLGHTYNDNSISQTILINMLTKTWHDLSDRDYQKTIYICDDIQEAIELLNSTNIIESLQKQLITICKRRLSYVTT